MAEVEVINRRGKDDWVDKSEAEAADFAPRLPCHPALGLNFSPLFQFSSSLTVCIGIANWFKSWFHRDLYP
jgi:hypothetical protein